MISEISRNSLAAVVEIVDNNGNVVVPARVDIREGINVNNLSDIQSVVAISSDNWGGLGYRLLGDARHWWAIAELSGVLDPFTELVPGLELTTVSQETLFLNILNGNVILNNGP